MHGASSSKTPVAGLPESSKLPDASNLVTTPASGELGITLKGTGANLGAPVFEGPMNAMLSVRGTAFPAFVPNGTTEIIAALPTVPASGAVNVTDP
jgi:hypothetical protein